LLRDVQVEAELTHSGRLDGRRSEFWILVRKRIIPHCQVWLCGPPSLLHNGLWSYFSGGKAVRPLTWPLTSN
jgi:hypothetical protein